MSHSTLHCPLPLTHMRVIVRTSRELVVEVVCTREVFMDVCVCVCVNAYRLCSSTPTD